MKNNEIDWSKLPNFTFDEFSIDPNGLVSPELLYSIQYTRIDINEKIRNSPDVKSLVRFSGSKKSQHYVGPGPDKIKRLSTGIDVFCEGHPYDNYQKILASRKYNGIGIYLDTVWNGPWIMFHLDQRPQVFSNGFPLIWIVEKIKIDNELVNKYRYPVNDNKWWALLNDDRMFVERFK
ncbi:MAG: hypothetical protein V3W20_10645 [Candidatus Neomarinimicrobiota bacterium]